MTSPSSPAWSPRMTSTVSPALARVRRCRTPRGGRRTASRYKLLSRSCSGAFLVCVRCLCGCVVISIRSSSPCWRLLQSVPRLRGRWAPDLRAAGLLVLVDDDRRVVLELRGRVPSGRRIDFRWRTTTGLEDLSAHLRGTLGDRDGHLVTDPRLRLAVLGAVVAATLMTFSSRAPVLSAHVIRDPLLEPCVTSAFIASITRHPRLRPSRESSSDSSGSGSAWLVSSASPPQSLRQLLRRPRAISSSTVVGSLRS